MIFFFFFLLTDSPKLNKNLLEAVAVGKFCSVMSVSHTRILNCLLYIKALPPHPVHADGPSHADVHWSAAVQQHAAVHRLHCLPPEWTTIRTVHLRYDNGDGVMYQCVKYKCARAQKKNLLLFKTVAT